ncbi:hypothetical protein GS464_17435 [Rhodococcus hoagii]|nr:hypothetical protein [Prescottella equi]
MRHTLRRNQLRQRIARDDVAVGDHEGGTGVGGGQDLLDRGVERQRRDVQHA